MDILTCSILEMLKDRYIKVIGNGTFDNTQDSPYRRYYLERYSDNLLESMDQVHLEQYREGGGGELKGKMNSVRSSSALTFNIFGNRSVKVKPGALIPQGEYTLEYEKKLPALSQPANVDAFLCGKDNNTLIFVEVKMAEWIFNCPGKLSKAYLNKERYKNAECFDAFEGIINAISKPYDVSCEGELCCVYEHYDAFQMLKHILGIYNAVKANTWKGYDKVYLTNCLWEIKNIEYLPEGVRADYKELYEAEYREAGLFLSQLEPIYKLFEEAGISFKAECISFDILFNMLDKSTEQKRKFERYII